jgi:hypothetical protein
MRLLSGGLVALAFLNAGCGNTSAPTVLASGAGHTVSEQQAVAARAQPNKPRVVISGPVGAEWENEYNQSTPPAARAERPPAKPRANAHWVPGHWVWVTYRWLWVSGFWQ